MLHFKLLSPYSHDAVTLVPTHVLLLDASLVVVSHPSVGICLRKKEWKEFSNSVDGKVSDGG
jgi:hypothetical protein